MSADHRNSTNRIDRLPFAPLPWNGFRNYCRIPRATGDNITRGPFRGRIHDCRPYQRVMCMKTVIQAIATANPPHYVSQEEAYDFYRQHFDFTPKELEFYERILLDGPIQGRYLGIDSVGDAVESDPDLLVERFCRVGVRVAAKAARKAMAEAGCRASDLAGLVVNTCTGYLCPGLSSYVVEELGLNRSIKVMDIMGMGCGAAIPNLECAAGLAAKVDEKPVLSIAVEVCSTTPYYASDRDSIISNCIFGDGAAAAIVKVERNGCGNGGIHVVDFESGVFPEHRDRIRFRTEQGRLRNILGRDIPAFAGSSLAEVTGRLLERNGLSPDRIRWWALHPGGSTILKEIGRKLELSREDLRFSSAVFREYGNMSSPTVMFVLRKILDEGKPAKGENGLVVSFGAGFSVFAALVVF